MLSVLVVEDERSISDALEVGLGREGFDVRTASDGVEGLELFREATPDIVLLDVMLPRLSGIDVCREMRAESEVPIIMVSAKGSEVDAVVGLEVGADDYVVKPYRLRELVARIRAVTRRRGLEATTAGVSAETRIEVGDVCVDVGSHEVTVRDGLVPMPLKEFDLLRVLLENAGQVLTREILIDRVWGMDYVGDTKTLDVHIKRLRAKVETDASTPQRIVTVRGVGYKYVKS